MRIKSWIIAYFFVLLCGLIISTFGYADDYQSNQSTNAVSASANVWIPNTRPGAILSKVVVSSRSIGNETITIYDSSATATGVLAIIDLSSSTFNTWNVYDFQHRVSSGITVSKSGSSGSVNIFWKKVR